MPSPSKSQFNLSIDSALRYKFKKYCDSLGISQAQAIEKIIEEKTFEQSYEKRSTKEFDTWLQLNRHNAPTSVIEATIFVHDTLEVSQRIANSLGIEESKIFEIYDRIVSFISTNYGEE